MNVKVSMRELRLSDVYEGPFFLPVSATFSLIEEPLRAELEYKARIFSLNDPYYFLEAAAAWRGIEPVP